MPHDQDAVTADDLALLVDSVRDYAMLLLSPAGEIQSWNAGAEAITGYAAHEAVGQHFSMLYLKEDIAANKPQHELETALEQGRVEDEGWRRRKDGTQWWTNTIITALHNRDGSLRGYAKVARDMTTRRKAEEALRQSEEIFRLLVASVKDYAIFLLDPTGHITTWNAGAQRIKGYAPEEIIGRHFSTFYPKEDVLDQKPERELEIAQRYGSVEDEGWRVRKDGTKFWANVIITAVHDETGELRGYAKVTRDMTERKRAEEMQRALFEQREARFHAEEERRRAEASYRVAQEANRAKDEFLMTLSHELRTPMTAILGWARLLPTMSPGDAGFNDAISAIARSAQLQARLIDDVLDVSRIVSGKLRLALETVAIEEVINGAIEAVRPSADARHIAILTSFATNLGTTIADPTRLQQVIWNLLSNAVKFTPKGGTIIIDARRSSSHVQISVKDNGEGIDPQFLPHMFEPFRQAENPSTRLHGGLGLGLSIVRYLVEAHGGNVSAESPGRGLGSTFCLTLPVGALKPEQSKHFTPVLQEPRAPIVTGRLAGVDVLLVDDDREARELVRAALRQAGANVIAVESARLALAELADRHPDLIITDIAMPMMDGYALAREIRKRKELSKSKLVALSAFPVSKTANSDAGFDEYLTKPIDPFELVDSVARVVGPITT
jgi:PAS domain S-box-containing protein